MIKKITGLYSESEGFFRYLIAHRIRTPLNTILGFSELLDVPNGQMEEQKLYIKMIKEGSQQLLSIVDNLLRIGLLESGKERIILTETPLDGLCLSIESRYREVAAESGLTFCYKRPEATLFDTIITDEPKLNYVLDQLVGNALKFTSGGYVYFGFDYRPNDVFFYVKDSGKGIPEEMRHVIFERFSFDTDRLSPDKIGLGLSISKDYLRLMGGKIWMQSEPGKGSSFYITLPMHPGSKVKTDDVI